MSQFFNQNDYFLITPAVLLGLFGCGILLIDFLHEAHHKFMNAVTALVGLAFTAYQLVRIQSQMDAANRPEIQGLNGALLVDHFAIGVEKFNRDAVTKILKDRGANPEENLDAGFHIKDPDGFDVQISNGQGNAKARKTAPNAKSAVPAPFESTGWQTIWPEALRDLTWTVLGSAFSAPLRAKRI